MSIITILILFLIIIAIYAALIGLFQLLFRITGLSKRKATFQTISLLTAVGFTTSESETIVSNPIRRRLAVALMILGNLLSIVVISLLVDAVSSFDIDALHDKWLILVIAFAIFVFVLIFFSLPFINKPLSNLIEKIGYNAMIRKNGGNVITILDTYGDDSIVEIYLNEIPEMFDGKPLFKTGLKDRYSINVMFIRRRKKNISLSKDTIIQKGDVIVVFGNKDKIQTLFGKKSLNKSDKKLVSEMQQHNDIYVMENYSEMAMAEINVHVVPQIFVGETIFTSKVKNDFNLNIMLIKRKEKIIVIDENTTLQKGDTLIVFGPYSNIKYIFGKEDKIEEEKSE